MINVSNERYEREQRRVIWWITKKLLVFIASKISFRKILQSSLLHEYAGGQSAVILTWPKNEFENEYELVYVTCIVF
jgi:hypothetical protein